MKIPRKDVIRLIIPPPACVVQFPVLARYVLDDAETQSGNPDAINSIRYYMSLYGYNPAKVILSVVASEPNQAGYNCYDVYGDYARIIILDSIFSAIEGGYIGTPSGPNKNQKLFCNGSDSSMYKMPMGHTAPAIADLHAYPCVSDPSTGLCYNNSNDALAAVQSEAAITYGDVALFFSLVNPSAVFMIGETHSNTNDGNNEECVNHAPLHAARENVEGYNQSSVAGHSVIFRPWINLADSSSCFPPKNQNVNQGNQGPYTPSQQ